MGGAEETTKVTEAATAILNGVQGRVNANFTDTELRNFCERLTKHAETIVKLEDNLANSTNPAEAQLLQYQLKKDKRNARKQVSTIAPESVDQALLDRLRSQRDADSKNYHDFVSKHDLDGKKVLERYEALKAEKHPKTSDMRASEGDNIDEAARLLMIFCETDMATIAVGHHLKFLGKPDEINDLICGARTDVDLKSAHFQDNNADEKDITLSYPSGIFARYLRPLYDKLGVVSDAKARVAERILFRVGLYDRDGKLNIHSIACLDDDAWDKLEVQIKAKTNEISTDLKEGKHLHKWNPFRETAPTHKLIDFAVEKGTEAASVLKVSLMRKVAVAAAVFLGYFGLEKKLEAHHEAITIKAVAEAKAEDAKAAPANIVILQAPSYQESNFWRDSIKLAPNSVIDLPVRE